MKASSPAKKKNKWSITKKRNQPKEEKVIHFQMLSNPKVQRWKGWEKYQSCHKLFQCPLWTFQPYFLVAWTFSPTSPSKQICLNFYVWIFWGSDKRELWKIVSMTMGWSTVSTHKEGPVRLKSKMECYEPKSSHHRNRKSQKAHRGNGWDKEHHSYKNNYQMILINDVLHRELGQGKVQVLFFIKHDICLTFVRPPWPPWDFLASENCTNALKLQKLSKWKVVVSTDPPGSETSFVSFFTHFAKRTLSKEDNFDSKICDEFKSYRFQSVRAAHRKWDDLVEEHNRSHVEVKHKILKKRNV